MATDEILSHLGPLAALAGIWAGDQGIDIAPSSHGPAQTNFRERITFEPMGPVTNGPQTLYALKYSTTAWPLDSQDAFHEELGYWLWDAEAGMVMRCFIVPRGVNVLAGGIAEADDKAFTMAADVGSETFGISSNPFLDKAFKTVRYELSVTIHDANSFSYAEDTQLQIPNAPALFHHTDSNTLMRII